MTDTDRMLAWLRETMDAAQADAEAAGGASWSVEDGRLFDTTDGQLVEVAREPGTHIVGGGSLIVTGRPALLPHIARQSPAAVLRRIAADRKTLDDCDDVLHDFVFGAFRKLAEDTVRNMAEGWGWTESPPWPECMCTPSGECGKCWEKRQLETT